MTRGEAAGAYPATLLDAAELHQIELLRPGADCAPLVLMAAGWNGIFLYRGLAERMPSWIGVGLLIAYPYPGAENTPILDAVVERTEGFERLLEEHPEVLAGRPIAVLGYSRGGLVAHEIGSRLSASGHRVVLEVLVDTLFPGEERHQDEIVSTARRSKYRALAESGQYVGIARELGRKAVDRAVRRGRGLLGAVTASTPPDARGDLPEWESRPLTTADYEPPRVDHPAVVYRACDTPRSWTTELWGAVISEIDDVEVEGRHTPPDSIMSDARVGQIAADLTTRLAALR